MHRFALLALLAFTGCSSTHGTGDCSGSAPDCYPGSGGTSLCCLDMPSPATCVDRAWTCRGTRFLAADCDRIEPICEGVPPDGGPPPPPIDYFACSMTSECQLTSTTCCGTCDRPTLDDVVAINASWQEDYYLDVACPEARTEPPPCPGCAVMPNPNLQATCEAGRCEELDVEADFSECSADTDCVLRVADCCECGGDTSPFALIALATSAVSDYLRAVCDPTQDCDDCAPAYPADVLARCVSGACRALVVDP